MDTTPGVDLILPDIAWLAESGARRSKVLYHPRPRRPRAIGHY
jgi:hypothetical protein